MFSPPLKVRPFELSCRAKIPELLEYARYREPSAARYGLGSIVPPDSGLAEQRRGPHVDERAVRFRRRRHAHALRTRRRLRGVVHDEPVVGRAPEHRRCPVPAELHPRCSGRHGVAVRADPVPRGAIGRAPDGYVGEAQVPRGRRVRVVAGGGVRPAPRRVVDPKDERVREVFDHRRRAGCRGRARRCGEDRVGAHAARRGSQGRIRDRRGSGRRGRRGSRSGGRRRVGFGRQAARQGHRAHDRGGRHDPEIPTPTCHRVRHPSNPEIRLRACHVP